MLRLMYLVTSHRMYVFGKGNYFKDHKERIRHPSASIFTYSHRISNKGLDAFGNI